MIAVKRGLNMELAHISGLLHDIYTYFREAAYVMP
jgi:HD superfamily phosphodiesterase